MKRPFSALVLALTFVFAPSAFAADEVTIAIPAMSLSFSSNYIAQDKGYWAKSGLAVRFIDIPGIGATNAALAGSVDFANASGPTAIRAPARGQKLLIIVTTLERIQLETVMSKSVAGAAGITSESPRDKRIAALKGKKIAVETVNSIVHGFLRYVGRKGGIDPEKDFITTTLQPPAMLAGLKSGAIDGFTMSMPWTLMPVHDGSAIRIASSPRGDFPELAPFVNTVVLTKPDTCDKRPTVCERLVSGLTQAFTFMHEQPKESMEILKKQFPGDTDVFAEGFEMIRAATPKSGVMDEAGLAKAQEFMVTTGMMTPDEKLTSFKDIYTNKYASRAPQGGM